MRKIGLVASATLSLLMLTGAPAAHATDLPDVPISVRAPSAVTGAAGVGYSKECTRKSSIKPTENRPISSEFCVYHQVDQVWGTLDFFAPDYNPGVRVEFDLYTYRCREADDVCVVIASTYGVDYTDSSGYWSVSTARTTQTWSSRYYKTCAALSTGVAWDYPMQCTSPL